MRQIPKKYVLTAVAAAAIMATFLWLSKSDESGSHSAEGQNTGSEHGSADSSGKTAQELEAERLAKANGTAYESLRVEKSSAPEDGKRGVDPSLAFVAMAQDYKQLIKFPPYSMPLSVNNHDLLNPYEFVPTKRPMDNDNKFSFELKVSRYVLFHGSPIPVTLTLQSNQNEPLPEVQSLKVDLLNAGVSVATIPMALSTNEPKQKVYSASYLPNSADAAKWRSELSVRVNIKLQGRQETGLVESFQYIQPVAKVTGIGAEKIEGPNLYFPMLMDAKQAGRYKVEANLFTATNTPVSHLVSIGSLASGAGTIPMRVHVVTLKEKQAPGPYLLKDILVQRLPDELGGDSAYGSAPSDAEYKIKGFPLDKYSQEKYTDPVLQEKLKFLEQLALPPQEKTE